MVTRSPGKVKNIISLTLDGFTAHLKYIYKTEQYFTVKTNQTQELDQKKKKRKKTPLIGPKCGEIFLSCSRKTEKERERVFGGQYGFVIFTFYLKRK